MKILRLSLEGFLSYQDETIDFTDIKYCAVTGENGSGKSSIAQGISWILFGTQRVTSDGDSVVNDNAEVASGWLNIEDRHGKVWQISRSKTFGSGGVVRIYEEIDDDWVAWGDHRNVTAEQQILEIVGMDEDAFYSLAIMDQASTAGGTRFTRADSRQRRDILMGLIPELASWGTMEANARNRMSEIKDEIKTGSGRLENLEENIEVLEGSIASHDNSLHEFDSERVEGELNAVDSEIQELTQRLGELSGSANLALAELENQRNTYKIKNAEFRDTLRVERESLAAVQSAESNVIDLGSKLEAAEIALQKTSESIKQIEEESEEYKKELTRTQGEIERREHRLEQTRSQISLTEAQIDETKKHVDALVHSDDSGECWLCHSTLSGKQIADLRATQIASLGELETELVSFRETEDSILSKLKTLRSRRDDLKDGIRHNVTEEKSLRKSHLGYIGEIDGIRSTLILAEESLEKMDSERSISKRIDRIEREIQDHTREFEDETLPALERKVNEADETHAVQSVQEKLKALRLSRTSLQESLTEIIKIQGAAQEARQSLRALLKKRDALSKNLDELVDQEQDLAVLVKAFSPKGVPSMLLDSILGAIETAQNNILASIPGAEGMRVEFRQTRMLKSRQGSKEVLDIIVHTADGKERAIESFSFGEKVRLTISNLFAMIEVFNARYGGMINTVFLDEPLGVLDENTIPAFVGVLNGVMNSGIVDSMLIVTHDQRVIDALPQRMEVVKTSTKGSRVHLAL